MTEAPVLDLGDIRGAHAPHVGPKLARLGQLAYAGWRVPDGYAVTVTALDGWLPATARGDLEQLLTGRTADLSQLADRARALIESQPLPSWLEDAVGAAHQRLGDRTGHGAGLRVAVRSSAVSEDGAGASFAGQYETYLGVTGIAEVLGAIRKCWASGYSAHALEYRRRFGGAGPMRAHDLAVGVLELVDVRSAGVVFTLDPVTGDHGTMVVEGNWGYGESVVSGHVSPDHWTVDKASGQVRTRRVGAKRSWSVFSAAAGRVTLEPIPDSLAGEPCLSDEEVRHLCEQAARIEAAEGVPQDVEWAIARDTPFPDSVFILQHRPETTWIPPAGKPTEPAGETAKTFDPVQYALRNVFKVRGA